MVVSTIIGTALAIVTVILLALYADNIKRLVLGLIYAFAIGVGTWYVFVYFIGIPLPSWLSELFILIVVKIKIRQESNKNSEKGKDTPAKENLW